MTFLSKFSSPFLIFLLISCGAGTERISAAQENLLALSQQLRNRLAVFPHPVRWDFVTYEIAGERVFDFRGDTQVEKLAAAKAGVVAKRVRQAGAGHVLFDPSTGRYLFELSHTSDWTNGETERVSVRTQRAFDGEVFGVLSRSSTGANGVPPFDVKAPASPTVADLYRSTIEIENVQLDQIHCGISAVPPHIPRLEVLPNTGEFFWSHATLLQLLAGGKLSRSTDDTHVSYGMLVAEKPVRKHIIIEFARSNDQITRMSQSSVNEEWLEKEMLLTYDSKFAAPVPAEITYYDWLNGRGYHTVVDNVSTAKGSSQGDFQIAIPPGTTVNDHFNQLAYTAGEDPVDISEAIKSYVNQHNVSLSNRTPTVRPFIRPALLAIVGLLSLVVLRVLRRRSALLICISLFSGETLYSNDNVADASLGESAVTWNGRAWEIPIPGKPIPVSQCGQNTVFLALDLLGVDYDPVFIAQQLKPTRYGIRLPDMERVLRAQGVATQARKSVKPNHLSRLKAGQLAIIALSRPQTTSLHYAIVILSRQGDPVLLDPPLAPTPFKERHTEGGLPIEQAVVLLCDRRAQLEEMAVLRPASLIFTPDDFTSGSMAQVVTIHNPGENPIGVSSLRRSCGCVRAKFTPAIIDPGGSLDIPITITADEWGPRAKTSYLTFTTAAGSELTCRLKGNAFENTGSTLGRSGSRLFSEQTVSVPFDCEKKTTIHVLIPILCEKPLNLDLVSSADLCQAGDYNIANGEVGATLRLNEELLRVAGRGEFPTASIRFLSKKTGARVCECKLKLTREIPFSATHVSTIDGESLIKLQIDHETGSEWSLDRLSFKSSKISSKTDGGWLVTVYDWESNVLWCTFSHPKYAQIQTPVTRLSLLENDE